MSEVAGALSQRVTLRLAGARGEAGELVEPDVGEARWASLSVERSGTADAGGSRPRRRWRVRMRSAERPEAGDRLDWRGVRLRVLSRTVRPETPHLMELVAEELA